LAARSSIVATILTLATCLLPALRAAQAQVKELGFSYAAHDQCPSADRFLAGISARTRLARFSDRPTTDGRLDVKISERDGQSFGWIELVSSEGSVVREIHDTSCSDVASALALSAALLIDPNASTTKITLGEEAEASRAPPTEPPRSARNEANEQHGSSPIVRQRWTAGIHGELFTGPAPNTLITASPFIELSRETAGPFAPSVRLSARRTESGVVERDGDHMLFEWTTARLELCPVRLPALTDFFARPCAGIGSGALRGAGVGGPSPQSETRLWLDASLIGRAGVVIKHIVSIEAQAGGLFPITRYDYVFQHPRRVVHRAGSVMGTLGLGIGVRFP
jgi:hypothetical protein